MTVTLYTNTSETIALDKELTQLAEVTGTLREGCSLENPVITFTGIDDYLSSVNYAYIPSFNRYYFLASPPESERNGVWILSFHVDVLTTYATQIRENQGIIQRQENDYDLLLNDGIIKTEQVPRIGQYPFPAGFDTLDFVLALAGQSSSSSSTTESTT